MKEKILRRLENLNWFGLYVFTFFIFSICARLKFNDSNNWLFGKSVVVFLTMCMVTAQVQRDAHSPPEAASWSLSQTKEKAHKMQILLGKIMLFICQYLPLHNFKQKRFILHPSPGSTRTFRQRTEDIHPLWVSIIGSTTLMWEPAVMS